MAFQDVHRAIRGAPYRYTWVWRNNNGNAVSSPSSPTFDYLSLDTCGYAGADPKGTLTVQTSTGGYLHYVDLTALQMTADLIEVFFTASGSTAHYARIVPEPALNSGLVGATNASSDKITLASTAVATDDYYNGATLEIVRGTGKGQMRAIVDYTSSREATLDRAWVTSPVKDEATVENWGVYIIHPRVGTPLSIMQSSMRAEVNVKEINGDATAAANLEKLYEGAFITSSVASGTPTTTSFIGASGLKTTDNFYNDMLIVFTSGNLKGIPRKVNDYDGTTLAFTTGAFPVAPAVSDTFIIIALVV